MRDKLLLILFLAAVFFGVGEWRGWYLGVLSQTPVFVYKKDHTANATRRTINLDALPLNVSGNLRQGGLTVSVYFERPESFQTGRAAAPERKVFEQSFTEGQRVALDRLVNEGRGIYRVELNFDEATGLVRVNLPTSSQL